MKKLYIFLIIGLIALGIWMVIYFYNSNKKNSNNSNSTNFEYNSARVSTEQNNLNEQSLNFTNEINQNKITDENSAPEDTADLNAENPEQGKQEENPVPTETLLSEFSTKIYSKDPERQNNVNITCSTLNGTTVENGETFSFTNTIGKATSSKGYKKADVFKDGEKVQALGGGNCQVSSTLYNAVLKTEGLKVTERHEHSNSVPYVEKGKDAAVAYGSYDFKFINNTGKTIKIESSSDNKNVYIKILKIE